MSAILIFAAGVLSVPMVDIDFSRYVGRYPSWAVDQRQQTASAVELTVLPDGMVALCRVLESVGNARLATEACTRTLGLKVDPAIDAEGKPVHGKLQTIIAITIDGGRGTREIMAFAPQPDIELAVSRLPDDADRLDLEVVLLVSPDGHAITCEGREMRNKVPPAEYVAVACEQVKNWRGRMLYGADGVALPYVTNLRVRFGRSLSAPES